MLAEITVAVRRLSRLASFAVTALITFALCRLLYGVDPGNPAIYCAIALLLALVAMAACLVPAVRAARVPPMEVLRSE